MYELHWTKRLNKKEADYTVVNYGCQKEFVTIEEADEYVRKNNLNPSYLLDKDGCLTVKIYAASFFSSPAPRKRRKLNEG
jgi:hypothetical protein